MTRSAFTEGALRRATDYRLRRKDDTTVADTSWHTLQIDPNSIRVVVAGTASNGDYVLTITPVVGTAASVTATRGAGETSSQMADALVAAIATATATGGDWEPYVVTSVNASGTMDITVKPGAPPFVFSTTPPGTATMAFAPDDTFPVSKHYSPRRTLDLGQATAVEVVCVQVDSSGNVLPNGSTTVDLTMLRVIDRKLNTDSIQVENPIAVAYAATETGLGMGEALRLPFNGGRLAVHLTALTSPHASVDAVEVWVKEVSD